MDSEMDQNAIYNKFKRRMFDEKKKYKIVSGDVSMCLHLQPVIFFSMVYFFYFYKENLGKKIVCFKPIKYNQNKKNNTKLILSAIDDLENNRRVIDYSIFPSIGKFISY